MPARRRSAKLERRSLSGVSVAGLSLAQLSSTSWSSQIGDASGAARAPPAGSGRSGRARTSRGTRPATARRRPVDAGRVVALGRPLVVAALVDVVAEADDEVEVLLGRQPGVRRVVARTRSPGRRRSRCARAPCESAGRAVGTGRPATASSPSRSGSSTRSPGRQALARGRAGGEVAKADGLHGPAVDDAAEVGVASDLQPHAARPVDLGQPRPEQDLALAGQARSDAVTERATAHQALGAGALGR